MENYKLLGRIGKGAHGLVFKALDKSNNKTVAVKQITITNLTNGMPKNTMREICVLRTLESPHIVELVDVLTFDCAIVIIMEYIPFSLAEILKDVEHPLELPQIKNYTRMLLLGVEAMHSRHLMHRDLKPANLLITTCGILKLADFGLSRIYNPTKTRLYTHQIGTRWYRAPELLYGAQNYTPAVDMWAVGCILAEMLDKQPLFPGESDIAQLAIVLATLGTPDEEMWPGLTQLPDYNKIAFSYSPGKSWESKFPDCDITTIDLIASVLKYNPDERIDAKTALEHRFFFEIPLPSGEVPPQEIKIEPTLDFEEIIKLD